MTERVFDKRSFTAIKLMKTLGKGDKVHLKIGPYNVSTVRVVCCRENEKERILKPLLINKYQTSRHEKDGYITITRVR